LIRDIADDIMSVTRSRTSTGRIGVAANGTNEVHDTAWVDTDELVWALVEDPEQGEIWWPGQVVVAEGESVGSDGYARATVKLYPHPAPPAVKKQVKTEVKQEAGQQNAMDVEAEAEAAVEAEAAAEAEVEAEAEAEAAAEKADNRIRKSRAIQPFKEAYDRFVENISTQSEEMKQAIEAAEAAETKLVNKYFKPDSRLLKRFSDFVESRAEMIADAIVYEFTGADDDEEHISDDEEFEKYEVMMRSALGNLVTAGYYYSDYCPTMRTSPEQCVNVTVLDLPAQNVTEVSSMAGVRFKLKQQFSATKEVQIAMSAGEVEWSDTWPCCLKVIVPWAVMAKLLKITRDNELWVKVDQMEGIVNTHALQVAGGFPARERFNKLQLRNSQIGGPVRTKADIFFVLPDALPGANNVGLEPVDAREIARSIESAWKAGRAMPGDIELWNLSRLASEGPKVIADTFSNLTAAAQRATAIRLLLEGKQTPHDLLRCSDFHAVEEALIGDVVVDKRPHPARCSRLCQGFICPACLCCCTGPDPHCVTVCARAGNFLSCTKAEHQIPLVDLTWWFPSKTMEPSGFDAEFMLEQDDGKEGKEGGQEGEEGQSDGEEANDEQEAPDEKAPEDEAQEGIADAADGEGTAQGNEPLQIKQEASDFPMADV